MDMENINVVVPTFSSYFCSSIGTSNLFQELYLFTICIINDRKESKATQFELLENPSLYSQETKSLSKSATQCCIRILCKNAETQI